jgi:hypothetical protein
MNGYSESYDFDESSFEDFDSDELSLPSFLKPGKKVSVPGAGLISATLNTPKGPAKLSLPTSVPTHTQFRQLESALNAQTQRLNAVQAEMAKMRRELVIRRQQTGQGSSSMMSMLMPMMLNKKLKDDLAKHTHAGDTAAAVIPESSSDAFSSILPLLMFAPGILGGGGSTSTSRASGNEQDAFSNPFVMMMLMDAL